MSDSAVAENFTVVSASGSEELQAAEQRAEASASEIEVPQKEETKPDNTDASHVAHASAPASFSSIPSSSSSASLATASVPSLVTPGTAEVRPSHIPKAEKKVEEKKAEVKSQPSTVTSPTPSKTARPASSSKGRTSKPNTSCKEQETEKEKATGVQHGRAWLPGGPSRKDGAFGKYMSMGSEPQSKEDEKKEPSDAEKKKVIHPPMHVCLVHGHDVSPSIALKFIKTHPPKRGGPSSTVLPAHARAPFAVGGAYAVEC